LHESGHEVTERDAVSREAGTEHAVTVNAVCRMISTRLSSETVATHARHGSRLENRNGFEGLFGFSEANRMGGVIGYRKP